MLSGLQRSSNLLGIDRSSGRSLKKEHSTRQINANSRMVVPGTCDDTLPIRLEQEPTLCLFRVLDRLPSSLYPF
jgi:hypothetical protein